MAASDEISGFSQLEPSRQRYVEEQYKFYGYGVAQQAYNRVYFEQQAEAAKARGDFAEADRLFREASKAGTQYHRAVEGASGPSVPKEQLQREKAKVYAAKISEGERVTAQQRALVEEVARRDAGTTRGPWGLGAAPVMKEVPKGWSDAGAAAYFKALSPEQRAIAQKRGLPTTLEQVGRVDPQQVKKQELVVRQELRSKAGKVTYTPWSTRKSLVVPEGKKVSFYQQSTPVDTQEGIVVSPKFYDLYTKLEAKGDIAKARREEYLEKLTPEGRMLEKEFPVTPVDIAKYYYKTGYYPETGYYPFSPKSLIKREIEKELVKTADIAGLRLKETIPVEKVTRYTLEKGEDESRLITQETLKPLTPKRTVEFGGKLFDVSVGVKEGGFFKKETTSDRLAIARAKGQGVIPYEKGETAYQIMVQPIREVQSARDIAQNVLFGDVKSSGVLTRAIGEGTKFTRARPDIRKAVTGLTRTATGFYTFPVDVLPLAADITPKAGGALVGGAVFAMSRGRKILFGSPLQREKAAYELGSKLFIGGAAAKEGAKTAVSKAATFIKAEPEYVIGSVGGGLIALSTIRPRPTQQQTAAATKAAKITTKRAVPPPRVRILLTPEQTTRAQRIISGVKSGIKTGKGAITRRVDQLGKFLTKKTARIRLEIRATKQAGTLIPKISKKMGEATAQVARKRLAKAATALRQKIWTSNVVTKVRAKVPFVKGNISIIKSELGQFVRSNKQTVSTFKKLGMRAYERYGIRSGVLTARKGIETIARKIRIARGYARAVPKIRQYAFDYVRKPIQTRISLLGERVRLSIGKARGTALKRVERFAYQSKTMQKINFARTNIDRLARSYKQFGRRNIEAFGTIKTVSKRFGAEVAFDVRVAKANTKLLGEAIFKAAKKRVLAKTAPIRKKISTRLKIGKMNIEQLQLDYKAFKYSNRKAVKDIIKVVKEKNIFKRSDPFTKDIIKRRKLGRIGPVEFVEQQVIKRGSIKYKQLQKSIDNLVDKKPTSFSSEAWKVEREIITNKYLRPSKSVSSPSLDTLYQTYTPTALDNFFPSKTTLGGESQLSKALNIGKELGAVAGRKKKQKLVLLFEERYGPPKVSPTGEPLQFGLPDVRSTSFFLSKEPSVRQEDRTRVRLLPLLVQAPKLIVRPDTDLRQRLEPRVDTELVQQSILEPISVPIVEQEQRQVPEVIRTVVPKEEIVTVTEREIKKKRKIPTIVIPSFGTKQTYRQITRSIRRDTSFRRGYSPSLVGLEFFPRVKPAKGFLSRPFGGIAVRPAFKLEELEPKKRKKKKRTMPKVTVIEKIITAEQELPIL